MGHNEPSERDAPGETCRPKSFSGKLLNLFQHRGLSAVSTIRLAFNR